MTDVNYIDEESRLLAESGDISGTSAPSISERLGLKKVAIASVLGLTLMAIAVFNFNDDPVISGFEVPVSFTDLGRYDGYLWSYTSSNYGDTSKLIYLDRHDVDCGSDAISYFRMERPSSSNIRYKVKCRKVGSEGAKVVDSYTEANGQFYGPKVHYIDRQPWAQCRDTYALTGFKVQNRGSDNVRYQIQCKKWDGYQANCESKQTGSSYIRKKEIYYLDRFKLDCGSKVMTGFRARGSGGTVYYDYKCCDQMYYDPTPQPIASPTETPTEMPISHPTAEPTKMHYIICPFEVTKDYKGRLLNLKEGCASFANHDIGFSDFHGSSHSITVCTDEEITIDEEQLKGYGLIGSKKENDGISFMQHGDNILITYKTRSGKTAHFENEASFVHSEDNDEVVSVTVTSHGAKNVPTLCSDV